jgi:hypothetical protein
MKKKRQCRERQKQQQRVRSQSCFSFSQATVHIAQEAMKLFEQSLQRATSQPTKIVFARQMMRQVNGKLDTMSKLVTQTYITTFDYNEKIILSTAIRLYLSDHLIVPSSPERDHESALCWQVLAFCTG